MDQLSDAVGTLCDRTDSSLEKNTADSKTRKQTQGRQRQRSPRVRHPLE